MEISRPNDLGRIANLGLTLADSVDFLPLVKRLKDG
jgi:hypothetical protein